MALGALFLVVLSAFLHAAWNAAAKGSGAPAPFVFLADLTALIVLVPAFFFFDLSDLTPEVWVMVLLTGAIHGGIFITYVLALLLAQIVVRWNIIWSVLGVAAAFVPFANFFLDRKFKKMQKEREEAAGIQVIS